MKKENKNTAKTVESIMKFDAQQLAMIKVLSDWAGQVENYDSRSKSAIMRLFSKPLAFKGVYLYGSVGSGKSTICHMLFEKLKIKSKAYFHFHEFMQLVHKKMFLLRQNKSLTKESLMKELVKGFAQNISFLYLDEMVVSDIADAMIVGNLISECSRHGIVLMITSNFHPEDLYKDGIQRKTFLGAIEMLKSEFEILQLSSDQDYRYLKSLSYKSFYKVSSELECQSSVDKLMKVLGMSEWAQVMLNLNGRYLTCNHTAKKIALFTFDELFVMSNSSADFLSICSHFNIIILTQVRSINIDEKNEVKRLISFIDTAYEKKIKLFIISFSNLDEIYERGILKAEFGRTLSRLNEMLSD